MIATDPSLIVRTFAVADPIVVTVAIATLLLVHSTCVKGNGEPSPATAVARTSSESPRTRLPVDADTSTVWIDGGSGGVDSLHAVSKAAASMIVVILIRVERFMDGRVVTRTFSEWDVMEVSWQIVARAPRASPLTTGRQKPQMCS